jgi:RNA polymerase sigma factor (sigma-70 family)
MLPVDRDTLVLANLPYARKLARAFAGSGLDRDDLEQEAALALVEASHSYDPQANPGVPFSAYARPFLVRRLGALIGQVAVASLPSDLPAPIDTHRESAASELWSALEALDLRDCILLIKRYGLDGGDPEDLMDLGRRFKLSTRRLADLLEQARQKLKAELLGRGWHCRIPRERGSRIKTA